MKKQAETTPTAMQPRDENAPKVHETLQSSRVLGTHFKLELDKEKKSVNDLREMIGRVYSMSQELAEKRKLITQLEAENASLTKYKPQYQEAAKQCEALQRENADLSKAKRELEARLAEMEKYKGVLDSERETRKTTEEKAAGLAEQLAERQRKEKESLKQAETLREERARDTQLEAELEKANASLSNWQTEAEDEREKVLITRRETEG